MDEDWVAFGAAETFKPDGIESANRREKSYRRKKKKGSGRGSSETRMSWMEKPINDDSSWMPVAPPKNQATPEGRDDGDTRRSSGTPAVSRPPLVGRRTSSTASEGNANRTSASSGSINRPTRTPRERARERHSSRGRAGSESRDQPSPSPHRTRGRSSSRIRGDSPSGRARSNSRTRSTSRTRAESASQKQRGRIRSTSRTRVESPSPQTRRNRTRSTSRTRVESPSPQTRRNRTRSSSRARVESPSPRHIPVIPPISFTEPTSRGRTTSMSRSQSRSRSLSRSRVLPSLSARQRTSLRSSNSVGSGILPRRPHSFADRSVSSELIGGRRNNSSGQTTQSNKSTRKEGGILERFFGDHVSEDAKNGFRHNVRSNVSVGSLGTAQNSESIHPRVLLSATVYKNAATNLWIATINTNQKGVATDPKLASKYLKAFSFGSEQEAREAAIANAPPKMMHFEESPNCFVCKGKFAVFRRARHCRNCGACVCGGCTTTWSSRMLPETYNLKNENTVNICKSCSYLTDSFRKALLKGDFELALELYHTGNINLRCPLPGSTGAKKVEIMYPIHCAVHGGNLDIVRWLMDEHYCPIKLVKKSNGKGRKSSGDTAIVTSKGRSALNIAMCGLKVDIIRYLVVEKGVPVYETRDLQLSLRALEAVLLAFPANHTTSEYDARDIVVPRWDDTNFSGDEGSYACSSLGEDQTNLGDFSSFHENQQVETVDLCILCYDRVIDSVITPCGHQICCLECSNNLKTCPVCNVDCNIIQIFKP